MGKQSLFVMSVFCVLLLAGCAGEKSAPAPSPTPSTTPTQNTPATTAPENGSSSPSAQKNTSTMVMTVGENKYEIELYDNQAVRDLVQALPQTITVSRWGDGEYYGRISQKISAEDEKRDTFEVGEVALWPSGNAFCIFFGPTPASTNDTPRMASPGVPFGKIVSDISALKSMGNSITVTLSAK